MARTTASGAPGGAYALPFSRRATPGAAVGSGVGGGGGDWAPPVDGDVVRLFGGAVPPVVALAAAGAVSTASDASIAMAFGPPTGPSLVGGGLHYRYRQPAPSPGILQVASRQRAVANAKSATRASGFTAVSVTARLTRTR